MKTLIGDRKVLVDKIANSIYKLLLINFMFKNVSISLTACTKYGLKKNRNILFIFFTFDAIKFQFFLFKHVFLHNSTKCFLFYFVITITSNSYLWSVTRFSNLICLEFCTFELCAVEKLLYMSFLLTSKQWVFFRKAYFFLTSN